MLSVKTPESAYSLISSAKHSEINLTQAKFISMAAIWAMRSNLQAKLTLKPIQPSSLDESSQDFRNRSSDYADHGQHDKNLLKKHGT